MVLNPFLMSDWKLTAALAPLEAITVPLFASVANKSLLPTASPVIKDAG